MTDPINPQHYKTGGVECIDYLKAKLSEDEFLGFCIGNVIKYLSRIRHKGQNQQDAEKALWYCSWVAGKDPRK